MTWRTIAEKLKTGAHAYRLEEAMEVVRQISTQRADAVRSNREMFVLNAKLATPIAISNRGNHKTRGLRAIRFCPPPAIQVPTKYGRGYQRVFV
jgi:hypothetical protein